MGLQKVFKIGAITVGGIMVGVLATSLTGNPMGWIQNVVLESLGVNPAGVQTTQYEENSGVAR